MAAAGSYKKREAGLWLAPWSDTQAATTHEYVYTYKWRWARVNIA
jgi:hypothetical protein